MRAAVHEPGGDREAVEGDGVDGADQVDAAPEALTDSEAEAGAVADLGAEAGTGPATPGRTWRGPSPARWALFAGIAITIVVLDQLSKGWIVANLDPGEGMVVLGEWLRLVHGQNSGILFGMLPQSAPIFAVVSMGVTALIVVYHAKAGQGIVTTIALGLLLGGAIGNLVDRLRYGYVVDFVDMGIGSWRFYTYNLADACITTAIILLLVMAVVPRVGEWGAE
jgi:signal peptidase II